MDRWSTVEVRAVVRFLNARNFSAAEIHRQLVEVYGKNVTSRQSVVKWCSKFKNGRVETDDYARSGRPITAHTTENKARVERALLENRRLTIDELEDELNISHGSIVRIIKDLNFHKVCARWVPRALSEDNKANRMACALAFFQQYAMNGHEFLSRIVTGDETWVHHHTPETKRASMVWKHPWSPPPQKFKVVKSAGKLMATVFWDIQGVLLVEFLEKGTTINAASYCETLSRLRNAIKRKCPGLLTRGVMLLHDNACPHAATVTQQNLECFKWTIIDHPPYSPDLAPSDFHLFPALKEHLSGQRFSTDDDIKSAVTKWLNAQGTDFYRVDIEKLVPRLDKCLNKNGDYVEK